MSNQQPKPEPVDLFGPAELSDEIFQTMELKNVFPTAQKVARYTEVLEDLKPELAIKALRHLVKTTEGMPDPAAVRRQVVGSTIPYSETAAAKREAELRAQQERERQQPKPDEARLVEAMNETRRMVGLPEIKTLAEASYR